MIVIDVGCARHGWHYSIERLLDEFHPDVFYGFDPGWEPEMFWPSPDLDPKTRVEITKAAAWTYDGEVGFHENGLVSHVTELNGVPKVPCFDLARFLRVMAFKHREGIVLKIDAEGAEYDLLRHLIARRADKLLKLAIVEWHDLPDGTHISRRVNIEREIACELREWEF